MKIRLGARRALPGYGQRGAAMVEFVLTAGLLFLLLFGILDLGLALNARLVVAAAAGRVPGAHREPRAGTINAPWVATREAWQQWYDHRRPAGRPKIERTK